MSSRNTLLSVIAGIAAGAALGILFTKGSKEKKNISKKGEALADALNDKIDEKFDELVNVVVEKVNKVSSRSDSNS